MARYPLQIPPNYYGGRNDTKRQKARDFNAVASAVETYINRKFAESGRDAMVFEAFFVARDLRVEEDLVRSVFQSVGGNNGLTVEKDR